MIVRFVSYHLPVQEQDGVLRRAARQPRTIVQPADPAPGPEGLRCRSSGRSRLASPWTPWSGPRTAFWLPRRLVGGTSTDEATVQTRQRLDGHAHHDQIHAPGLFTLGHGVPGDSS